MLVFDRHALRCVIPPTEECDVPTTPLPLEGDLPENNVAQRGGNNNGQLLKNEQERQVNERRNYR